MTDEFEKWWEENYGFNNYGNPPPEAINAFRAGASAMRGKCKDAIKDYPYCVDTVMLEEIANALERVEI